MKKKIALWGTGTMALAFYYSHKHQYDVVCFFDNDVSKQGSFIDGRPVYAGNAWGGVIENTIFKGELIVIASTWWVDIARQLDEEGFMPLRDYIPLCLVGSIIRYSDIYGLGACVGFDKIDYSLLTDKKIACLWGNCQTSVLERIFTFYQDFVKEYVIVELPKVCEYEIYTEIIMHLMEQDVFWEYVDLFIYQTVHDDNRFHAMMATEGILRRLRAEAIKVNILNLYFMGYFPQIAEKKERQLPEICGNFIMLSLSDCYIDKMLSSNISLDLIKNKVMSEDFIPESEISMVVSNSFDELASREKKADIKITDYLMTHYKEEQLFYRPNHPTEKVLLEYADRIMAHLGYSDNRISLTDMYVLCGSLKGRDIPIYPAVIKALCLGKYEKKFHLNRWIPANEPVTFEEYVDLYIENSYCGREND